MKKLFAVALLAFLTACTQVDTGNIGVETSFGKVSPESKGQGVYITVLDNITEFTTKEVYFPVSDLAPKSRDNLTLKDLDLDIYFAVVGERIPGLYVKYQGDYAQHGSVVEDSKTPNVNVIGFQRVAREAREAAYKVVAQFDATTMHTKREEIAELIRKELQTGLDATDKGAFVISNVNVRNLTTDPAIEKAIQAQIALDQDLIKKGKEVTLAQKEAERQSAAARGEAEANRILSESLSDRVMQLRLAEINRETIVQSAKAGNTVINGNVTPLVQVK